jgi:gluconolactonase
LLPDVEAVRVEGVPPTDSVFAEDTDLVILEGPVWLNGTLYLSEINGGPTLGAGRGNPFGANLDAGPPEPREPPPARVLALSATGEMTVAFDDVGTNGLAIDSDGNLVGCSHKTGSIQRFGSGEAPVDLVTEYLGSRFNSPNDLTFGSDGTLYFSDPDYQAPEPVPQEQARAYRVAPGTATAIPIVEDRPEPNGVTLSPDQQTLYVSASDGIFAYPVQADGSVGEGVPFAADVVRVADGMAVDCAGNLYAASNQTLFVLSPAGSELFRISFSEVQSVTNVAFGGADGKTVYVTALGSGTRTGLFQLPAEIPGMPY